MALALRRILYVEDEPDIRTIAVTVLESVGGFEVIACPSGREAIEVAPRANADLIVLDVMMPGLDGPATLEALRKIPQTATTPVIFMTAKVQSSEIQHLKGLGALDVIAKPFDPMTLSAQIDELWQRHAQEPAARAPGPARDADLESLYASYAAHVPALVAEIEALWSRLVLDREARTLKALHVALHSLAGSGGTFGFPQLGKDAKALETAVAPYLEKPIPAPEVLDSLRPLLLRITRAAGASDARA